MKVMNQQPILRPQLAASVSVAQAPRHTATEHNNAPRFGASNRTFLGFFGRMWNSFVEWLHSSKDAKERENPIPRLNEERNRLVTENQDIQKKLAGFEGKYVVAKQELTKMKTAWEIEEQQADASAAEYNSCLQTLGEQHAETQAALALANKEAEEAESAKNTYEARKTAVDEMELTAMEASETRKTNEARLTELVRDIEQAARDFEDAKALEQVGEMKRQLDVAKGLKVGQSNDVGELIRAQKERKETARVLINDGKTVEQRKAEHAVMARVKTAATGNALQARLAKLNQTAAPKAETANSGTTTPAPTQQGNPIDNAGKK